MKAAETHQLSALKGQDLELGATTGHRVPFALLSDPQSLISRPGKEMQVTAKSLTDLGAGDGAKSVFSHKSGQHVYHFN